VFEGGVLVRAARIKNPEQVARGMAAWRPMATAVAEWLDPPACDLFVSEEMWAYRGGVSPVNLFQVTGVNGALCKAITAKAYVEYPARVWKRQTPQADMERVIKPLLTDAELSVVEPCTQSLMHDLWHGVGLGLYALGRLDPSKSR
jgi:hypothetical protein